jgi:mutator protein MutT
MKKAYTLCMVSRDKKILLGYKKRGFGAGYWNGFGGKVEAGESVEAAAKRELLEEVGITAQAIEPAGVLEFSFASDPKQLVVYVFHVTAYDGEPKETEEMRPSWFAASDIPFSMMWPDDIYWLPVLLAQKYFQGTFHFDKPAAIDYMPVILSKELMVQDTGLDLKNN